MDNIVLIPKFILRESEIKRQEFYLRNGIQITPRALVKHLAWRFSVSEDRIRDILYREELKDYL
jgi:hypothetical protein